MDTIIAFAILFTIQSAFILISPRDDEPYYLRGLVIVNMILIGMFAARLFEIGGLVSNVGNIMFASVVAMQAILITNHGHAAGLKTIAIGARSLMLFSLTGFALAKFPLVDGNHEAAIAVDQIANTSLSVITASFLAFKCGQYAFLRLLDRWKEYPLWGKYTAAMIILQIIDSLIFFPIAFGLNSELLEIALVGFITKVVIGIIYLPIIYISKLQHGNNK